VATDLLRALRDEGLATRQEEWMRQLGTPAAVMRRDAARTGAGLMAWDSFVDRYRWVRPGTYDIAVPAYGDDPEGYLRPLLAASRPGPDTLDRAAAEPWHHSDERAVSCAVAPLGLDATALEAFCHAAITGRERGKTAYASWVSAILEAVAARGAVFGLSREQVRHLRIGEVLTVHPGRWPGLIARRESHATLCALVELPDVITCPGDVDCFARRAGRPTFVTTAKASGPVCMAPAPGKPPEPNAVIVLEAADPGFDWVFAHRPGALVTAYGGANSHMAIRCAELGIPAAIGVGPATYEICAVARSLTVDAGTCRVDVTP
jgi:phosphohistidine swiveling domain-containing protein